MKVQRFLLAVLLCLLCAGSAGAKEIYLKKGEIYRDRDLSVICEGGQALSMPQVLSVRECQYWDDFAKKCLFERTIYTYHDLQCMEECQHWDSFSNSCDYRTKCTFYPAQEAFVHSGCEEFDTYTRKCVKVREEKITGGRR